MFRKSVSVVLFVLVSVVAMAQQGRPRRTPAERAERQTRWMRDNLRLSKEQDDKVYGIILHYAQEADKVRMEPKGREKKMDRQDMMIGRETELKQVLSPDQYSKYIAHLEEMKQRRQQRRGEGQMEY